jgi:SAM-dependent methyltransferase
LDDRARRFWDERAGEDPYFFVDNRLEYGEPDLERFWAQAEEDLRVVLDAVGVPVSSLAGADVVEIGCGVGRLTRVLAQTAASVRALDVSPRMIELASEHNPSLEGVEWIVGDGTSLAGIESDSADACVSHVVFQHIADPAVTLGYVREIARVLRPGGFAVFQISNDPAVHAARRPLGARIAALARRGPRGQDHPDWRGSYTDLGALRAAAGDGGMRVERVDGEGTQWCIVLARRT